jgi:hypothetical protein
VSTLCQQMRGSSGGATLVSSGVAPRVKNTSLHPSLASAGLACRFRSAHARSRTPSERDGGCGPIPRAQLVATLCVAIHPMVANHTQEGQTRTRGLKEDPFAGRPVVVSGALCAVPMACQLPGRLTHLRLSAASPTLSVGRLSFAQTRLRFSRAGHTVAVLVTISLRPGFDLRIPCSQPCLAGT